MQKRIKWIAIILGGLILLVIAAFFIMRMQTKSHSPEATVDFNYKDLSVEVFYNRPFKKGRKIFGELVSYGKVWRTGANEATTFTTNKDILVDGSLLEAGKYTLWTIPGEKSWKVIFNKKMYDWGVGFNGKPSRNPEYDVLTIELKSVENFKTVEQFTIYFNQQQNLCYMFLAWENTVVAIPFREDNL